VSAGLATLLLALALSACGGGGGGGGFNSSSSSGGSSSSSSSGGPPTEQARINAATTTAGNNAACASIRPFYWEIGDGTSSTQPRAGGTLDTTTPSGNAPDATTVMNLYSASKWLFGAYVVELRGGVLSAADIAALNMTDQYNQMRNGTCTGVQSVAECDVAGNGVTGAAGPFHYNSGHFQHLGAGLPIGIDHTDVLKTDMDGQLGTGLSYTWTTAELAGGASDSATGYRAFLRRILGGPLSQTKAALGMNAVATNPSTTGCTDGSQTSCIPGRPFVNEQAHYSLGHWVEDDPSGDGAFSSPGFAGFYPWIDSTRTWYGIVAREVPNPGTDDAFDGSIVCGRLIRHAWLTGVAQ
jgi:hypothetical protein